MRREAVVQNFLGSFCMKTFRRIVDGLLRSQSRLEGKEANH